MARIKIKDVRLHLLGVLAILSRLGRFRGR